MFYFKPLIFTCILVLFTTLFTYGQTSVSGTVIDSLNRQPVSPVVVVLKSLKNPNMSRNVATDEKGNFTFKNVRTGTYTLFFSYIGYIALQRNITLSDNTQALNIGNIALLEDSQSIESVEITAQANPIIVRKDTIEYVASAYKVSENAQVEDLLKKMQGVEIDKSTGKITVNGKEVTKIMLDGKLFFSGDPALATKNLPANMVDKIQVVDKKSDQSQFTGMDDGNEETIINLTVKSGMKEGWMGNVAGGLGRDIKDKGFTDNNNDWRFTGGGMVSRFKEGQQLSIILSGNNINNQGFTDVVGSQARSNRGGGRASIGGTSVNLGGSGITTSYLGGINFADEFLNKNLKVTASYFLNSSDNAYNSKTNKETFLKADSSLLYNNISSSTDNTLGHRFNAEIDWSIDSVHSLLFRPTVNFGNNSSLDTSFYQTLSSYGDSINQGSRLSTSESKNLSASGSLLYRLKFDKPGRTFSTNINFSYSNNIAEGYDLSYTLISSNPDTIDQMVNNNGRSINYSIRATYTEPLGRNFFAGITYGFSQNLQQQNKETYNKEGGHYTRFIDSLSNLFDNNFINHNVELTLQKRELKYTYTVGITLQPSTMTSVNKDTTIRQPRFNFAPTADFTYKFGDNNQLRLDYRGRTNQPTISQLQPVVDNSDPLYQRIGNYDLVPEFVHNFNFRYRFGEHRSSKALFVNGNFSFTQDKIINSTTIDSTGKQIVKPVNINGIYSASLRSMFNTSLNSKHSILKLFYISNFLNTSYSRGISLTNNVENKNDNFSINDRLRFSYRGTMLDGGVFGSVNLRKTWYSIQNKKQPLYITYSYGIDAMLILEKIGLNIGSDVGYTGYVGYEVGYDQPVISWNGEVTQILYRNKRQSSNVLSLKLRVIDILNQSRSTNITTSDNYNQITETNILGRYFMFTLGFRFGSFGNSSSNNNRMGRMR